MKTTLNPILSEELALRKAAHIELAASSQTVAAEVDGRFNYEPLFFSHPQASDKWETSFLNFKLDYPFWISSMTGGAAHAKMINENLARLCGEYKLGMGLGSCRSLLGGHERIDDFKVRRFMGEMPLFANLGLAQVEELVHGNKSSHIHELIKMVEADGLIIHINPLQEWFQPEGDRYRVSPLTTLSRFLETSHYPVLVKEVGQGMGPQSLKALLELPIAGIELAGFGGTNFSLLESLRGSESETKSPFVLVGHTAREMVEILNALPTKEKQFIISGGMKSVLDGYECLKLMKAPSLIGMAQAYLVPAMNGYDALSEYFLNLRESLLTAKGLLQLKGEK